jgi:hypothetical protein
MRAAGLLSGVGWAAAPWRRPSQLSCTRCPLPPTPQLPQQPSALTASQISSAGTAASPSWLAPPMRMMGEGPNLAKMAWKAGRAEGAA